MADRAYVMESGRMALEGAAHDLLDSARVRRMGADVGLGARTRRILHPSEDLRPLRGPG
jgi:hypothetical protein